MEYTLKSGATLAVTIASMDDADDLNTAILNCMKGMKLPDNPLDIDTGEVIRAVLEVATAKDVKAALWKCFARATYNGQRLTKTLFDDPELAERLREDYYEICLKVIEVNCRPFVKRAGSLLSGLQKIRPGIPEPK